MEIGFPFMGDRLSLCRYSWAKRLTVYSFIFSFLWVSFPRYSYSFVPAIAAVAARAVIPKVVGRVLVRRFAANDAIYTASQLTATRVFVGRAAANASEYLPAASSYKMSGVATWAGIAAAVSSFVPSSLSSCRLSHVIHGLIRLSTVLLPTCLIFLAATFQAPSITVEP